MSERVGLRRKIWVAFILQAAAISFAAVLGVYGASAVLKHVLIQRALQEEAGHFWKRRALDPAAQVPDTYNMNGYLLRPGERSAAAGETARARPRFPQPAAGQGGSLVMVEDQGSHRLFLVFKQEQVDALAFWFGMVPLALVLAGRLCHRLVHLSRVETRGVAGDLAGRPGAALGSGPSECRGDPPRTTCRATSRARPCSWRPRCMTSDRASAASSSASAISPATPRTNCARR